MAHLDFKGIADWWRGYSDSDVISLRIKLAMEKRPGSIVMLTHGEYAALRAGKADSDVLTQKPSEAK